jgi:3,4-dihydroxy-2-butanone 4-phosphate synthase
VSIRKVVVVASLALSGLIAGTTRASEVDQAVKVNFSQPVQIPGRTLPAGTYYFSIINTSDRETVQISNEDRTRTIALIQTINRVRPEWEHGGTAFTLASGKGVEPPAVIAWFYPGRTTGHEFVYPKQEEKELAMATQATQVSGD